MSTISDGLIADCDRDAAAAARDADPLVQFVILRIIASETIEPLQMDGLFDRTNDGILDPTMFR